MPTAPRLKLLPLGLLASGLVVSSAFGQCPPIPEGSLPKTGADFARAAAAGAKRVGSAATHVAAATMTPVNLTPKSRMMSEVAVLDSEAKPEARRPGKKTGKAITDEKFTGPISISVPGTSSIPGIGLASKIVEQDGRILLVGGADPFTGQVVEQGIFLTRFEANGTLDPSFGEGGSIRIVVFAQNKMVNNSAPCVALTPDGKIVVARTINDLFEGNTPGCRVVVIRLTHDGALDPTFGTGGVVFTTIKNRFLAYAVAVQRDSRIIVAGQSGHTGDCLSEPCLKLATLVRYQSDGHLDPTFGNSGVVRTSLFVGGPPALLSKESAFSDVVVQDNGLIVAAGTVETGPGTIIATNKMLLAEYLPTGELNPAFGGSGAVMLGFDGSYQKFGAASLVIRENGRILAGGSALLYQGDSGGCFLADQAFIFAQLTLGGDLDTTFGNAGKVVVNVHPETGGSPAVPLDRLNKVMLTPAGDLYAAGMASEAGLKLDRAIVVVALRSDGSLNQSFGTGGWFSLDTYSPWHLELADDALLTSSGRLVISGTHWPDEHDPDAFVLWAFSVKAGPAGCP